MHSYWDDFFALRGFKDAVYLAAGSRARRPCARGSEVRDQFERELAASVKAAMAKHRIDYIPGCADLGDFDATSTTIALEPCEAEATLPRAALRRTFERYWEFFRERRERPEALGGLHAVRDPQCRRVRAPGMARARRTSCSPISCRTGSRPAGGNGRRWCGRIAARRSFIGDLPHTWVGSDFVRSVLDMFAYARETDDALVVGAGVPRGWVASSAGLAVRGLGTPYGPLAFSMKALGGGVETLIESGPKIPRGGIVVNPPALSAKPFRRATVNGAPAKLTAAGTVVVRELPAVVVMRP